MAVKLSKYLPFLLPWIFLPMLIGCDDYPGKYIPTKLIRGKKPSPKEDFIKLHHLFKQHDGAIVTTEDKVIKWKDTKLFRMYELNNHTIVVFPYNWKKNKFDLIVFAGHVKEYTNLYDSIFYKYKRPPPDCDSTIYYHNETMKLDPSMASLHAVCFENFCFGDTKETILEKQLPLINSRWSYDSSKEKFTRDRKFNEQQRNLRINWLIGSPNKAWGDAKKSAFRLFFKNGKVAYMNFWIEGVPQLGGYSINNPQTPILEEGEFDIPEEILKDL